MNDEERLDLIRSVDNAGKQTYRLLENLLYWSRSHTGRLDYYPREINIVDLVKESYDLFLESAKAKEVSLIPLDEKSFTAYGDEDMIKTVLRNLISNAVKFSSRGSIVKVALEEKGNERIIKVVDNGVGISPNQLTKIFRIDAIASVPGTSGERGTGLGLVLCKEFVEKNGGKIWVESELGKGSTFSFSLPEKSNSHTHH
jgi:signal transduction histidine kinase